MKANCYRLLIGWLSVGLLALLDLGSAGQAIIDNATYSADGVHPNAAGAAQLVALTTPLVKGLGGTVSATSLNAAAMTFAP